MPTIEESAHGEWFVVSEKFSPERKNTSGEESQFNIIIRYVPGEGGRGISAPDILVTFDDEIVPFTFEEENQTLETSVSAVFGSSKTHILKVVPGEGSGSTFPSFTLTID
jgi:hypothetical protein